MESNSSFTEQKEAKREDSWVSDVMRASESGQGAFDAFGVHSEASYGAIFELMVEAASCEEKADNNNGEGKEEAGLIGSGSRQEEETAAAATTEAMIASLGLSGLSGASHAGPQNLAGDPYARENRKPWPEPVRATSTKTHASSGTLQRLQSNQPIHNHPLDSRVAVALALTPLASTGSFQQLQAPSASSQALSPSSSSTTGVSTHTQALHNAPPPAVATVPPTAPSTPGISTAATLPGSSNSSSNTRSNTSANTPTSTATPNNPISSSTITSRPATISPAQVHVHQPTYASSSLTLSQRRGLLRRCKSRDLTTTRRELVSEFAAARKERKQKMEDGTTQQMLACSMASPQNLAIVSSAVASEVPRYSTSRPSSAPRSEYSKSPFSLSAENLHSDYHTLPSRPHSMSSLQVTPVAEVSFNFRRASEPNDHSVYGLEHTYANDEMGQPWGSQHHLSPSVEHSITESPPMDEAASRRWWDEKAKLEEEWAFNESQVVPQQLATMPQEYHAARNGSFASNGTSEHQYSTAYFLRQPPSPALDENEAALHSKRSMSANSSVPSPPESPGFVFSAASSQLHTPEIGFPPTPTLANGSFQNMYTPMSAADHIRNNSIPPTPSSRRSSVSHCSAIQAATAALSATTAAAKNSKSRPNSRPGSSRRKTSNSSMRSAAHCSPSMDMEMSFVNFTPNDAGRILSGVAPSGSSKTKARREREAQEKRRKLSEAAEAAVMAAGGDPSLLSKLC